MVFLGVDVGGTHTDAVLLEESGAGKVRVAATAKALTKERIIDGLNEVLGELLLKRKAKDVKRLTVSTTLGLNSVLTGTADKVGILATQGPGLELDPSDWGDLFRSLDGQQDHRGHVVKPLDPQAALQAAKELANLKVDAFVVASKFGPKNPQLEQSMFEACTAVHRGPVMAASRLFGGLNFPRRLAGAVLNAAVKRLYETFLTDLTQSACAQGLNCPIKILKADGGVMSMEAAREKPVLALAAGPAASLLGLWALTADDDQDDILMIDMGGTSTDLALFSRGRPLMTPIGLTLARRPTLVRGLLTRSIALGGDTDLEFKDGAPSIVARRRGPALAFAPKDLGQRPPTLTDAFNVLGLCALGDTEVSKKAFELVSPGQAVEMARRATEVALTTLKDAVDEFIRQVNQQPVYTISDYLVDWRLDPHQAIILGGPAHTMAPLVEKSLSIPTKAPEGAATANALGASLAKPTVEAELYADTEYGTLSVPTLNYYRNIDSRYRLENAKAELLKLMGGEQISITAEESFNQLSDRGQSGKVIRVAAQSATGLIASLI
ncbi:MAG: hydantoinase/oxoprolinase family protein [Deltaproteobacteria bacterium]|nr:hydantoinase/oxoprolinase family protein [Deltaproteobacteria bacterium]